jgi:hypothetical protein
LALLDHLHPRIFIAEKGSTAVDIHEFVPITRRRWALYDLTGESSSPPRLLSTSELHFTTPAFATIYVDDKSGVAQKIDGRLPRPGVRWKNV